MGKNFTKTMSFDDFRTMVEKAPKSKLETALPSILETLCLLDELLVATRCTTVSNR